MSLKALMLIKKVILAPFEPPSYLKKSKLVDIHKKYKIPKNKFIFTQLNSGNIKIILI